MAQKKKPNIVKKPVVTEQKKTEVKAADVQKTFVRSKIQARAPEFLFDRRNYIIMLTGIVFMIIGFLLMIGGGSKDPNVFNYDIFNAQRLTVAPIMILLGFVIEVFAIMLKPKAKSEA